MNVVLCRVLNAHALVAAPQLSLGRLHGSRTCRNQRCLSGPGMAP